MKPNNELRVLITGGNGLLGTYLHKCLLDSEINCLSLGRKELDITSLENIDHILMDYRPNIIVNCAAYTNVEKAETDREACFSVNVSGVINLIQKSNEYNCKLVQISTDFVFDGVKESGIYFEDDIPNPINYYGLTKYMAEKEVIDKALNWIIVRTAWLYGKGSNNFVTKIIELSTKRDIIYVTESEMGSPTYALDLAKSLSILLNDKTNGIHHITNFGYVTRLQFASEILKLCGSSCNAVSKISEGESSISNVSTTLRPQKSILQTNREQKLRNWYDALIEFCSEGGT